MIEIDHLSATQLKMLKRCPKQWYYRYVEKLKIPPPGTWATGTSGHAACAMNFEQKPESGEDLPKDTLQDFFGDHLKETKDEYIWDDKKQYEKTRDTGISAVGHWREKIAPPLMPAMLPDPETGEDIVQVERRFEIPLGNVDYNLIGYIDLETENSVDDFKFPGRRWNETNVIGEIQPMVYWSKARLEQATVFMKAEQEGLKPELPEAKKFRYHVTTTAKTPVSQTIEVTVDEAQINAFMELIARSVDMIQKEVFPDIWGNYLCNPKGCGYFTRCRGCMTSKVVIFEHDEKKTRKKK